jgi:HD superfamily phosphohydrolase
MKIIRDLIHGYIEIDEVEMEFINSPSFQRLKDIRQLTAQHAFPSANHTRFEHSLGVLHLAKKAFMNLKPIIIENYQIETDVLERFMLHLRLAALLHDIGHAPFSHLGEKYFRRNEIIHNLKYTIKSKSLNINSDIFEFGSNHELMSCYIILYKYSDPILRIRSDVNFELICRMIVGAKYNNSDKWLENILIELINSDTIDADKLDYLMRDAFMTGVSIPSIDTSRLFLNIRINPKLKRITFKDKAIPVIQNIIDARDTMYLFCYNHHTVVYSDFILEFFIKHMISNFERENRFLDKLDPNDFFSCKAIADFLVTDSVLENQIRAPLRIPEEDRSKYTKNLINQIIGRKHLKPLWKSIYEYKEFMIKNIPDIGMRKDYELKMCDKDHSYRRLLATDIINSCELNLGDIFIIPRSNKFYSLDPDKSSFRVSIDEKDKDLRELLPQKDFREMYTNVNFYVFCLKEKIELVRNEFIKYIQMPLPQEKPSSGTELEWLKEKFD